MIIQDTFQVRIDGRILPKITKQEFAILELLLRNPKQVFSKEDIFEYAWDEPYMGETKTLDVHISNIRKKIKQVTFRRVHRDSMGNRLSSSCIIFTLFLLFICV
jgi:DNA-binding response OmpR family regulator